MTIIAMATFGAMIAAGLVMVATGWRGTSLLPEPVGSQRMIVTPASIKRWVWAVGVGLLTVIVTGMPAAAVIAGATVGLWPHLFGGAAANARKLRRLEALSVWAEAIRDSTKAGNSLEQALSGSAANPPAVLREELARLGADLETRVPMERALRRFNDAIDDETSDLFVGELLLNQRIRGPQLTANLTVLAESTRQRWTMRRQGESKRRSIRRTNKTLGMIAAGVVVLQWTFTRDTWIAPYGSPSGQLMLLLFLSVVLASFVGMRKAAEPARYERILKAGSS